MLMVGLVFLVEVVVLAGAALHRLVKPPSQRLPLFWVWLMWNVLPFWVGWRAVVGRVLRLAAAGAERAVERHERAQATATYPPAGPS